VVFASSPESEAFLTGAGHHPGPSGVEAFHADFSDSLNAQGNDLFNLAVLFSK
jgi:hypothetical protein